MTHDSDLVSGVDSTLQYAQGLAKLSPKLEPVPSTAPPTPYRRLVLSLMLWFSLMI